MLKITATTCDAYGNTYPTDVCVKYMPDISTLNQLKIRMDYTFFVDKPKHDAGFKPILVCKDDLGKDVFYNDVIDLTEEEASTFNPAIAMNKAIESLEIVYGAGNVVDIGT